jgi:(hydroxyamino)benzene mutase
MSLTPATLPNARHPLDPDPVRSTKARGVLALGIVAALTGFFLGGLVPATLALLLARQARAEQVAAAGFLTGGRALRVGVALAWVGIVLAATALVIASIIGLLHYAGSRSGPDFGPNVN